MEDSYSVFLERIVRENKILYVLFGVDVDKDRCHVSFRTSRNLVYFSGPKTFKISFDVLFGFVNNHFQKRRYSNPFLQSAYNSFLRQPMVPRRCRYCSEKLKEKNESFFQLHYKCSCKVMELIERKTPSHVWDALIAQKI